MLNRRTALGTLAGVSAGGLVTPSAGNAATLNLTPSLPPPVFGPRMNFVQAEKVMTELGLDAVVVGQGTNLYHATGLDLTATKMGHTPGVYAIVTRAPQQRLSLVAPSFLFYYTIALDARHSDYPAYLYEGPGGGDADAELAMDDLPIYPDLEQVPLDSIETERLSVVQQAVMQEAARPNLKFALARALKDLGLTKGRIAGDWPTVKAAIAEAAPEATVVDADDALRRIRPVKSEAEITLMRYAAQANAEAGLEAARTVRAGADVRELRAAYFAAGAAPRPQGRVHGDRPGQFADLSGNPARRPVLLHRLRQSLHGLSRRLRPGRAHRRAVPNACSR